MDSLNLVFATGILLIVPLLNWVPGALSSHTAACRDTESVFDRWLFFCAIRAPPVCMEQGTKYPQAPVLVLAPAQAETRMGAFGVLGCSRR